MANTAGVRAGQGNVEVDAFEARNAMVRVLQEMDCLLHLATSLPSFGTPDVEWDVILTVCPTIVCKVPSGTTVKDFVEEVCFALSCR